MGAPAICPIVKLAKVMVNASDHALRSALSVRLKDLVSVCVLWKGFDV